MFLPSNYRIPLSMKPVKDFTEQNRKFREEWDRTHPPKLVKDYKQMTKADIKRSQAQWRVAFSNPIIH